MVEKALQQYKKKLQDKGHTSFDLFIETDPTANKKYVRWIVDSYVNGGIANDEDLLSRLKPALESYTFLKSKNILSSVGEQWQQETNIDNFCGLIGCKKKGFEKPGIEDLIDKYKDQLESLQDVKEGESFDIYNGETIRIVQPTNKDAACYYGQGTRWCTAATKGENMFDEYNKTGALYIILPKKPAYTGEKYQLSFGSDFYANEKDESLKIKEMVKRYPEITVPLAKYFIPLEQSNLNDPELVHYNIKRAIKVDDLDIYRHYSAIKLEYSLDDLKLVLHKDALEIFKYMVEKQDATNFQEYVKLAKDSPKIATYLFETYGFIYCSQRGVQEAIKNNNNVLFDAFWMQCPKDFKYVYLIDAIHSDNAHAFSVMRSNGIEISANFNSLPVESQHSAIDLAVSHEAPNILEYILGTEQVSQQDKFKIYSTLYTYFVEEPAPNQDKLNRINTILYKYGMYDEMPNYILENPDRVVLLDHLNLDSRTNFEILNSIYQPESLL